MLLSAALWCSRAPIPQRTSARSRAALREMPTVTSSLQGAISKAAGSCYALAGHRVRGFPGRRACFGPLRRHLYLQIPFTGLGVGVLTGVKRLFQRAYSGHDEPMKANCSPTPLSTLASIGEGDSEQTVREKITAGFAATGMGDYRQCPRRSTCRMASRPTGSSRLPCCARSPCRHSKPCRAFFMRTAVHLQG